MPVEGRLVVIQKQQGMASNYDCSTCYCPAHYTALSVAPGSFGLIPTVYQDMGSTATYSGCNGSLSYYNVTSSSTWSSNNTPVIHMDTTVHYRADAASAGTATVLGSYTGCTQYDTNPDLDCPCISNQPKSASGGGTVQVPTFLWPQAYVSATSPCANSCELDVKYYQVLDANRQPIYLSGLSAAESVASDPSGTCTVQMTDGGTWTTNSTGTFTQVDRVTACCPQGASCTGKVDQSFTVNGNPVQVLSHDKSQVGSHYVITIVCTNGQGACPVWAPVP